MRPLPLLVGGGVLSSAAGPGGLLLVTAPLMITAATPTSADASLQPSRFAEIPPDLRKRYIPAGQIATGCPGESSPPSVPSSPATARMAARPSTRPQVTGAPPILGPALDGRPGFAAMADPTEPGG